MLTLRKLQLNNFLSHEETEIIFKNNEKLLLDGISGSGKSSIVESIVWSLYGRGRSENNRGLIKSGKSSARVILTIEDNDIIFRIERVITKAGKNSLKVTTGKTLKTLKPIKVTGFKAIQNFIEKDLLHSSYLLFINSIAYPQDNVENFVKQTAGKRKDIILEIVNASVYDDLYVKTRAELSRLENETTTIESSIKTLTKTNEEDKTSFTSLPEMKTLLKKNKEKIVKITKKKEELQTLIKDMEIKEKENEKISYQINTITEQADAIIKQINESKETYTKILSLEIKEIDETNITKKETKLKKHEQKEIAFYNWNAKIIELQKEKPPLRAFDSDIKEINQQIIKIINKPVEDCPELNKPCPLITKEKDIRIAELEERLNSVKNSQIEYLRLLDLYTQKEKMLGEQPTLPNKMDKTSLVNEINEMKTTIQTNNDIKRDIKTLYEKIIEKQAELIELQKKREKVSKNKLEVFNVTEERKELLYLEKDEFIIRESINENSSDIAVAESIEKRFNKNIIEIKEKQKQEKELDKSSDEMSLLKDAFSPNGIKAIVIDYVIPRLEDKINEILHLLSDFSIRLDTQRKGVKEDVVKEGLFISILNEAGEEFEYSNYSGGEKIKIIVAISEALSDLQNIGFRIFDEIFIGLDEDSTEKFATILDTLQSRFSQMICISHLRNIKDLFDNKLIVSKKDGTSTI